MQILEDRDTDFIILAGIRYGIGRASYAPGLICDWIKRHWNELSDNLKTLIKRDITSEIEMRDRSPHLSLGMDCDVRTWREFKKWLEDK